jgi:hypothetical protein
MSARSCAEHALEANMTAARMGGGAETQWMDQKLRGDLRMWLKPAQVAQAGWEAVQAVTRTLLKLRDPLGRAGYDVSGPASLQLACYPVCHFHSGSLLHDVRAVCLTPILTGLGWKHCLPFPLKSHHPFALPFDIQLASSSFLSRLALRLLLFSPSSPEPGLPILRHTPEGPAKFSFKPFLVCPTTTEFLSHIRIQAPTPCASGCRLCVRAPPRPLPQQPPPHSHRALLPQS